MSISPKPAFFLAADRDEALHELSQGTSAVLFQAKDTNS